MGQGKLDANAEMWGERQRAYGLEREKLFWGPTGVAVDDENRIFVCESARNRIQVYRKQSPTFVGPRLCNRMPLSSGRGQRRKGSLKGVRALYLPWKGLKENDSWSHSLPEL